MNGLLRKLTLAVLLLPVIYLLSYLIYPPLQDWVRARPSWLQFLAAVVIQQIGSYWGHRLSHTVRSCGAFMRSITRRSDGLARSGRGRIRWTKHSSARLASPVVSARLFQETFGAFLVLETLWAIFLHSNVRLRFGKLEQLIATPAFHHWHHTNDDPSLYDNNFAGLLPAIDWLFGTIYLPDRLPERYGILQPMPNRTSAKCCILPTAPGAIPQRARSTARGGKRREDGLSMLGGALRSWGRTKYASSKMEL